jgi:hypothetical protein
LHQTSPSENGEKEKQGNKAGQVEQISFAKEFGEKHLTTLGKFSGFYAIPIPPLKEIPYCTVFTSISATSSSSRAGVVSPVSGAKQGFSYRRPANWPRLPNKVHF